MKLKLHWQILIALVLGATAGILMPGIAPYVDWIGDIFLNALSMMVVPIIFFSISTSLIGIQQSGTGLKSLGLKTIGYYFATMLIAVGTGFVLVNIIQPGTGIIADGYEPGAVAVGQTTVKQIIVDFIPKNMFQAFTLNNTLPVIVLAFIAGLTIPRISEKGRRTLGDLFDAALELTMKIVGYILKLAPYGIFAILVKQFAAAGDFAALLQNMAMYVVTVVLALSIHSFVWLPLILRLGFRVNPWKHFRNMATPLVTAFSTASSGATLPMTLEAVERNDGVSAKVSKFTLPLGATVNMDGTALLECVAVIFIAQAYGVELTLVQQVIVALTSLLCAVGAAGIPMAALVTMAIILNVVGLPLEGIGLVVGVDRILDMMRTAVNVYGDTCVAVMVAKSEGEQLNIDIGPRG
ncbi:MAG: dicarboxylate/amino acid:cation symporter [Alistipes sp.]|nr:dicarboxylate/amino acid:cation symporter [Alistipes sp.]